MVSGRTKSCGCAPSIYTTRVERESGRFHIVRTHGLYKSRFWKIWKGMKRRCHSPSLGDRYLKYGGRGISVCDRWHTFSNFMDDMYPAYLEHEKIHGKDTQIDRVDPDGNYEPTNCRWLTQKENLARRVFKSKKTIES